MMQSSANHKSCSTLSETADPPDLLFPHTGELPRFVSRDFRRTVIDFAVSFSQIVDTHAQYGARICYLRVFSTREPKLIALGRQGLVTRCVSSADFGSLLSITHEGTKYTLWLPGIQEQFRFDSRSRIEDRAASYLSCEWALVPRIELRILQRVNPGEMAIIPYVILKDPGGTFFDEINSQTDSERRLYRKSDWFYASRPLDIWKYLINGSLYDPRSKKGIDKRFKCQQCAFAWWNYFSFLHQTTGKKVYGLLQDEVAYSILLDLSAEGEWGHGFWSDEIETHARFHLDGVHLLISQYERTGNPEWLDAAERGMGFVFDHLTDRFSDGTLWFLHDTLEVKNNKHRFRSTLFGESPGNSLCLNTHVQALTVLHRLARLIPHKPIYGDKFERGASALRRVLDYQPGEPFYRVLAFMLEGCYRSLAHNTTLPRRINNAVRWRVMRTTYWRLKRLFPRLVLPRGFIERDLTLNVAADNYHNTNLKDLLTLYQQMPYPWLRPYIRNGFAFERDMIQKLGLIQAVERSPYYFEFLDILDLYHRLIEPLPAEEMALAEDALYKATGGCSLDYYASELVRGQNGKPCFTAENAEFTESAECRGTRVES